MKCRAAGLRPRVSRREKSGVTMRYRAIFVLFLGAMLAGAVLTGCSGKPRSEVGGTSGGGSDQPPMAQSETEEFHHDDPCSLLDPKEVEPLLGGPLGTAPYRARNGNPAVDGNDCVYQSANFQVIALSVDFEGGQQAYHIGDFVGNMVKGTNSVNEKTKKAMVSEDGAEIAGEWDEAKLTPFTCCVFSALRADQLISIDFTGSSATLKQAAGLVDAAFKRMAKPLSLDGGANVAAAKSFLKTRPAPMEPCSVLSQAEAEAILGSLAAPPAAKSGSCTYEPAPKGAGPVYELRYDWHGGNYDFRTHLQGAALGGVALGSMQQRVVTEGRVPNAGPGYRTVFGSKIITTDEAAQELTGQTFTQAAHLTGKQDDAATGPWERSATIGTKFEAVKRDIEIQVDLLGVDPSKAKALVAAAIQKL
jgi:hypothetical protein